jgi:hypothetical protein
LPAIARSGAHWLTIDGQDICLQGGESVQLPAGKLLLEGHGQLEMRPCTNPPVQLAKHCQPLSNRLNRKADHATDWHAGLPLCTPCCHQHALDGIPFTHRAVSVFRHLAEFQAINPVVKAPTLILDDGSTLMDSTLILDYLDTRHPERSLMPRPCLNVSTVCTCWDWRLLPWKKRAAGLRATTTPRGQTASALAGTCRKPTDRSLHPAGAGHGKQLQYQCHGSGRHQHRRRLALQP